MKNKTAVKETEAKIESEVKEVKAVTVPIIPNKFETALNTVLFAKQTAYKKAINDLYAFERENGSTKIDPNDVLTALEIVEAKIGHKPSLAELSDTVESINKTIDEKGKQINLRIETLESDLTKTASMKKALPQFSALLTFMNESDISSFNIALDGLSLSAQKTTSPNETVNFSPFSSTFNVRRESQRIVAETRTASVEGEIRTKRRFDIEVNGQKFSGFTKALLAIGCKESIAKSLSRDKAKKLIEKKGGVIREIE